ncbi:hypothetical protein AX016_0676 [Cellulophaga sp. RHA19]|uniref:hypothetical protein n=1 Tax=Cellulophaga sp. RHA19 TaxID=1798237 RepID=UPI000C2C407E|nr:hypothetical protein [Cellulophaga sp. RHA19]PKB42509.1 hypothetical protein AX016_0676 [Cellulophaga sp. RHA19]
MNKVLITIITFIFLISCNKKSFQVESKFDNGNSEIIYLTLSETTIYGKNYSRKFKVKFNEKEDTLRKGIYINKMALGEHLFYENNKIICKRNYIIPNPFFIDNKNETVDFSAFKIRPDSTYLNTAIFFDINGDSIIEKSHFYKTNFHKNKWNVNDSLKVDFEFYYPDYEVVKSDLYFMVPQDTSMITLAFDADKDYTFKRKIFDKKHNQIKGLVEFIAFDKNKKAEDSTAYAKRIMFINEKFRTE